MCLRLKILTRSCWLLPVIDLDMLTCLYYTGGRIGEILRLTWKDVNLERRQITLWTRKRFGGGLESDQLAMPDMLFNMLQYRWKNRDKESPYVFPGPDGQPWTYDQKRNLMRDLCRKAKVRQFGFHAIRHHVASILMDSGKATIGQIQKFLRHKRKTTTENYLHDVSRDLVEIAGILDEKNGQATDRMTEKKQIR